MAASTKAKRAPKPISKGPARPVRGTGGQVVHETLQREILSLTLPPGAPLDETQLARRFGLSRSPVREALNRLSAQNLVVMLPNRSTLVAPVDMTAFPRYVEALDLLQRITTRLAAEHRTESDIAEMKHRAELFDASVERRDNLEMSGTNKAFHMAIAEAGRNPYLARHYETMLDEGRRLLHLHFDYLAKTDGEHMLAGEHHEMVEAIAARDVEAADLLAHEHTRQFHDRFLLFMKANYATDFRFDLNERGQEGGGNSDAR